MRKIILPIAILIVIVLIAVGGAGYYFYKTSQEQKEVKVAKPEQVVDETTDLSFKALAMEGWKVYESEKYGFVLKFPESWADFEVEEYKLDQSVEPGLLPPYYNAIDFRRIRTRDNGQEFDFAIQIQAYSHDQWAVRQLNHQIESSVVSPGGYPYLGENKDYVFSRELMEYISYPDMPEEEYTMAKDIIQLRRQEAESIISTFKIINPLEKTTEWKNYFNPGECRDIREDDYTNECYLESLKSFAEKLPAEIEEKCKEMSPDKRYLCYAYAEVGKCGKARPDYQDFCYYQVAQTLKQPSICQNLSVLINQEVCYQNVALSLKKASICQNIQTERYRDDCYAEVAKTSKDISVCDEIKNIKLRSYCYRWVNPPQPELPTAPVSEWKTYLNEKHKYSFKHPPKWNFKVDLTNPETREFYVIRERISNEPEWPAEYEWLWNVVIETWDNPQNLILKDWLAVIKGVPQDAPRAANTFVGEEKIEALRIWQGGVDTTWDEPGRCFNDCPNVNVYFVYRNKGYRAALVYNRDNVEKEESQKIFNQILSTFKFTPLEIYE